MKTFKNLLVLIILITSSSHVFAQETASLASLIETSEGASQFYKSLLSTELINTLEASGPYTILAPSNSAFEKVDSTKLADLQDPENKKMFTSILKLHIIKGKYDINELTEQIANSDGTYRLRTLNGDKLTFSIVDGNINVTTEKGGRAIVNVNSSVARNGVFLNVDALFVP